MKDYDKVYIECRLFIMGDKNTGKKSFIKRLLSIPSTSIIRDKESEEEYTSKIKSLMDKYVEEQELLELLKEHRTGGGKSFASRNDTKTKGYKTTFSRTGFEENTKSLNNQTSGLNKYFGFASTVTAKNNNMTDADFKNTIKISSIIPLLRNHFQRLPAPENPALLFNVHKAKIILKPYYIQSGEELPYDFVLREEEDEEADYDLKGPQKISMKGMKIDVLKITTAKRTIIELENLGGYDIKNYNIFLFLYDLSEFSTFETLIPYHRMVLKNFQKIDDQDSIFFLIGNKKDKKVEKGIEQQVLFNEFISGSHLKNFEISTKPFFNFEKFFIDFIFQILGSYQNKLCDEDNFKSDFEKLITNKPTFSRAIRESVDPTIKFPGPDYDLNIFSLNSPKDLLDLFTDKKKRFNKKIFTNKQGPIFFRSKSNKDILTKERKNIPCIIQSTGGLLNKPIAGYSLGIVKGKLGLIKSRKDMFLKRNASISEMIRGECDLYNSKSKEKQIKGEEYFEKAELRKTEKFNIKNSKLHEKIDKLLKKNQENLKSLEEERETKKNNLINHLKLVKSSSTPNLLGNSLTEENIEEKESYKKRFCESIFPKHKEYMQKYYIRRNIIEQNKEVTITPGPNAYDVRGNIYDPLKGPSILGKRKEIKFDRSDPSFPDFKDEFELIVEKAEKNEKDGSNNVRKQFKPRFQKIMKEEYRGEYRDKKVWEKWNENRNTNLQKGELRKFLNKRKDKIEERKENLKIIQEQNDRIREIKREIKIKKGYEDPYSIRDINYSLVEEQSPIYTIKGKLPKKMETSEGIGNLLVENNLEKFEKLRNEQLKRPLPNIANVRPKLPNIKFSKDERFRYSDKPYQGPTDLFLDGIFMPKTQEDFFGKQPMDNPCQRTYVSHFKSPSPAEYKIKSSFEIIAEQGKKISDNKKRIKMKEEMEKLNKRSLNDLSDGEKVVP